MADLHPRNCLGAGEGIFDGLLAQAFSDGVPPDIACDVLDLARFAQDVVVIAEFPKFLLALPLELKSRTKLENPYEFKGV